MAKSKVNITVTTTGTPNAEAFAKYIIRLTEKEAMKRDKELAEKETDPDTNK